MSGHCHRASWPPPPLLLLLALACCTVAAAAAAVAVAAAPTAFPHRPWHNVATDSGGTLAARTVQTKYGAVRGSLIRLGPPELPDVEAYLGVPYATPPTGGLRFMPPVTPSHWRGVRLVNRLRPVCPQQIPEREYRAMRSGESEALKWMPRARYEYLRRLIPMLGNQSEDCLYLNIYTPAPGTPGSESGAKPVLVLLHAESYDWHSGNVLDGSVLASYGQVLLVTLNFRLGVLGFLPAFMDGTIRGNYGLMDQVAALHWIQENIAEFGGSPGNVTLVGHGHGAACAHLLLLSPMAKGLFQRVMLMSGSALSPWAIARDPARHALSLGARLNCTDLDTMIDCLRTRKVTQLLAPGPPTERPEHLSAFGPIIDSIVVPYDPRHLYGQWPAQVGGGRPEPLVWTRPYDLLAGVTDADAPCLFSQQESVHGLQPERRDRMLRTLVRNLYDYHQQAIFLVLFNEYSSWTDSAQRQASIESLDSSLAVLRDALVLAPLVQAADLHGANAWSSSASASAGRVFLYRFETNQVLRDRLICPVGLDLAFLLGDPVARLRLAAGSQVGPFHYPSNVTRAHQAVSELFMQYVANFARHGDPNAAPPPPHLGGQRHFWPRYEPRQKNYLALGSPGGAQPLDHGQNHRLSLWLNLIPRLLVDDGHFFRTEFGANLTGRPGARPFPTGQSRRRANGSTEQLTLKQAQPEPYSQHHLLLDYHNPDSYDGPVRPARSNHSVPVRGAPSAALVPLANATHSPVSTVPMVTVTPSGPAQVPVVVEGPSHPGQASETPGSATWWLMVIGAACGTLFFTNLLFFAALFQQLRKNRKPGAGRSEPGKTSPRCGESATRNIKPDGQEAAGLRLHSAMQENQMVQIQLHADRAPPPVSSMYPGGKQHTILVEDDYVPFLAATAAEEAKHSTYYCLQVPNHQGAVPEPSTMAAGEQTRPGPYREMSV